MLHNKQDRGSDSCPKACGSQPCVYTAQHCNTCTPCKDSALQWRTCCPVCARTSCIACVWLFTRTRRSTDSWMMSAFRINRPSSSGKVSTCEQIIIILHKLTNSCLYRLCYGVALTAHGVRCSAMHMHIKGMARRDKHERSWGSSVTSSCSHAACACPDSNNTTEFAHTELLPASCC